MLCPLRNFMEKKKPLQNLVLYDFYLSRMSVKLSIILVMLCIFLIINTVYLPKDLLALILLGNACLCLCPILIRLFMVLLSLSKNIIEFYF